MGNVECCAGGRNDEDIDSFRKQNQNAVPLQPHYFNEAFHGPNLEVDEDQCTNF